MTQPIREFGTSLAHSILLRNINDNQDGAPSCVIRNHEQVLADQAQTVLAFWRHLDRMTPAAWEAFWKAAGKAAGEAAEVAAWLAAEEAGEAGAAAGEAGEVAAMATNEIQGAAFMRANNHPFFFLPLFGFSSPEEVLAADA